MKLKEILEAKQAVTDADVAAAQKFFDDHPGILTNYEKNANKIKIFKQDGKLHACLTEIKYDDPDSIHWTHLNLTSKDINNWKIKLHAVSSMLIKGTSIHSLKDVEFPDKIETLRINKVPISTLQGIGKASDYNISYDQPLSLKGLPSRVDGQLVLSSKTATNVRDNPVTSCNSFWVGYMAVASNFDEDGNPLDDEGNLIDVEAEDVPAKINSYEGFPAHIDDYMAIMYCEGIKSYKDISAYVKHCPKIAIRGVAAGCGLFGLLKIGGLTEFLEVEPLDQSHSSETLTKLLNDYLEHKDLAQLVDEMHDAGLEEYAGI